MNDHTPKPIFGVISIAMAALAVVGFCVGGPVQGMNLDASIIWLFSIFGLPLVGGICAVVGILRQEDPKIFSNIGLLANAAIPIIAILRSLPVTGSGKGGSWYIDM
jgi:hypothetical protein